MSHPHEPSAECLFCDIVVGVVPCAKVMEDAMTFAFMDIDPGSDGHLHVIPRYRDRGRDRMQLPFEPGKPADADAIAARALTLAAAL